ncbi:hypothetical protein Peur_025033 [Populus x canadensis]
MSHSCWKPAINDKNPDVSQAAVYGIGICAGLGGSGSVFKPLAGGTFQVQCCNKSSQCTSFGQYNAILTMLFQLLEKYVICAGEELATEQTVIRMINLLRKIQQMLPSATIASTLSSLEPQQQLALQSILSS